MKEIGLIGFGNFGRFLYARLKEYYKFYIYDVRQNDESGVYSDISICLSREIIILAIPVGYLEEFLVKYAGLFNKNALVLDVSSVKIKPMMLMKKYLPEGIEIIGTHPLFGPNSVQEGLRNLKIVICPLHTAHLKRLTVFLSEKLGLEVIVMLPEEHDREMAYVQALTHFIAKGLKGIGLKDTGLKTRSFEKLYEMFEILRYDTDDLFHTIENENPHAADIRRTFLNELNRINDDIDKENISN